ncbi:hypothetical protein Pfo_025883, partial [Paulownia fortunei]
MAKEGGIAASICLLCFLCFGTISSGDGWSLLLKESRYVRRLLVNTAAKLPVNPPLGTNHHTHRHNNFTHPSQPAKPTTSQEKLDDIIQYCCTQPKVDCKVIQAGGVCYLPPNKISDASVVMNIYYKLNGKHPFNCDFKGSGLIITEDPCKSKQTISPFQLLANAFTTP